MNIFREQVVAHLMHVFILLFDFVKNLITKSLKRIKPHARLQHVALLY